jgi:Fur family ferric uptake transcriptional regulator
VGRVMAVTSELDRTINERLGEHDLRYTRGRRAIVDGLRSAGGPVTLPELLELSDQLALSSAYRNLALLEGAGVVRRLAHGGDHARYELAESLTEHHHHMICESCGSIRDVVFDAEIEAALETALDVLGRAEAFAPRGHTIDVYGTCRTCPT